MVALALSSMATTLERIEQQLAVIPTLQRAVTVLENQHDQTLLAISEAKGTANLAGNMAARALGEMHEKCDRIEYAVGRLALSIQGLEQSNRSVYDSMFPTRDSPSTPPEIELADVVPIHRSRVLTGE